MKDDCAKCGHTKTSHIYEEGACRPGFMCESGCEKYEAPNQKQIPPRVWVSEWIPNATEVFAHAYPEPTPLCEPFLSLTEHQHALAEKDTRIRELEESLAEAIKALEFADELYANYADRTVVIKSALASIKQRGDYTGEVASGA